MINIYSVISRVIFIYNPRNTNIFTQDYLEVISIKKGYNRLLLFQLIIFLILLLNSFVLSMLSKYYIVIFLLLITIVFKYFFGLEKDRNRYVKDVLLDILIILMIFFLIYYLSGIFIGFIRTDNYYSYYGITTFIIPLLLSIILKEYLRYNMLKKSEGNKLLVISTCILFIMIDLTNVISINIFTSVYKIFMFMALTLLPIVSENIVCTYISTKLGYKPNLLWLLVINLYSYLLPIVPNISDYLYSIIFIIFPVIIGYRTYLFMQKSNIRNTKNLLRKKEYISTILTCVFLIIVIYFTSGYFKYYAITIGSGSMLLLFIE